MKVYEGVTILLTCPRPHEDCSCSLQISDGLPDTDSGVYYAKAITLLAHLISKDWDEALFVNHIYDAGAHGWMHAAFEAPAPSEREVR